MQKSRHSCLRVDFTRFVGTSSVLLIIQSPDMAQQTAARSGKQWYEQLTIDLFARVLSNSVFHPFIAWIVPLCLRAVQAPYESPKFIAACVYAALVTTFWMLSVINKRVAYGLPREVDWNEEVVVITGGASGLGKILAETYGMRGASVAVLDIVQIKKESEALADVKMYQCDIGDVDAVEEAGRRIEEDVRTSRIIQYIMQYSDLSASSARPRF